MGNDGIIKMTELELIKAAKQGDEKAFTEIFNTYKLPLYYFILRRVRNQADTEDILMETFERAFASIIHFVPLVKLNTWLYEIARNRVTDFFRVKMRIPLMAEMDNSIQDNFTPERYCIIRQELNILQEGIRTLESDAHRKMMVMYCQGWKMREIASEMKIPLGTIQNCIYRSKIKLKKLVA